MSITPGNKLGPYEIIAPLGAGGMGEVYRARDKRLERDVAVKVLPEHLSTNPDLKARFDREAKAISGLQHPHICVLHDVGSQDGVDFLVMELLDGETLAQRLERKPLAPDEALKTAIEVADALDRAHSSGIVHRDLKPGNIMLTRSGAKLMDFGLAKPSAFGASSQTGVPAFSAVATQASPASPITMAGTVVGTVQYMSPEQIQGREADARSDIFAFGAVLYEMFTGKRAFEGKSQLSVASAILEKEPPPMSSLQPMTPAALEHVVQTCLAKEPEARFQSMHDVRLQLQWIAQTKTETAATVAQATTKSSGWLWAALAMVSLVAIGAVMIALPKPSPPGRVLRAFIPPPPGTKYVVTGDTSGSVVISPDGANVAFVAANPDGQAKIWVRPVEELNARQLQGTDNASFPFWSPDSKQLGFFADGKMKTIAISGASPTIVCDAFNGRGGAWGADGTILFSPDFRASIYRVPAAGGERVQVTTMDTARHSTHRFPHFLPDGKHFLYLAANHANVHHPNNELRMASIDGKEDRKIMSSDASAIFSSGYLLSMAGDQLMAQPFDPATGKLSGTPERVEGTVLNDTSVWTGVFDVSQNGLLVYAQGTSQLSNLTWYDRNGKKLSQPLSRLEGLNTFTLSPNGDRVAMVLGANPMDLYQVDLNRGVRTRLTFGAQANYFPSWSPDQKQIAFICSIKTPGESDICAVASDGSGEARLLLPEKEIGVGIGAVNAAAWSPDGKTLLYELGVLGQDGIWAFHPGTNDKPVRILRPPGNGAQMTSARFSPNGRWISYVSSFSGRSEVYVATASGAGKWQVSVNGGGVGGGAFWRKDGKEMYYLLGDNTLMAVSVMEGKDTITFGQPQPLFRLQFLNIGQSYGPAPDGQSFLVNEVENSEGVPLVIYSGWLDALKKSGK